MKLKKFELFTVVAKLFVSCDIISGHAYQQLSFASLVVSYKLLTVKSKTIGFLLDRNLTVHSSCLL